MWHYNSYHITFCNFTVEKTMSECLIDAPLVLNCTIYHFKLVLTLKHKVNSWLGSCQ